jgi:hypothetical protein
MEEGTSLDELLNGTPAEPETVEQVEAVEPSPEPETIGQPRDEHGRFAPKEEKGVETPPEPAEASAEPVPPTEQPNQLPEAEYKALRDERRKRQEAEARAAQLEAQWLAAQQQQRPAEPEPEFWDNPQAVIASQVQQAVMQALEAQKQQQTMERITESENAAKGRYADYDDAFLAFQQAATANPLLVKQMTAASDPAEFAYKTGKTALELSQVGSIDALLQRERAKWEAEARAAMPAPPALPSTTATDGSVGARTGPAWAGPAPIGDMLG